MQIVAKADNIKRHCEGYYIGKGKDRQLKETAHAKRVKALADRDAKVPPPPPLPTSTPTIVVNIVPEKTGVDQKEGAEPAAKKARPSGKLDGLMNVAKERDAFLKDLTKAFAGVAYMHSAAHCWRFSKQHPT